MLCGEAECGNGDMLNGRRSLTRGDGARAAGEYVLAV